MDPLTQAFLLAPSPIGPTHVEPLDAYAAAADGLTGELLKAPVVQAAAEQALATLRARHPGDAPQTATDALRGLLGRLAWAQAGCAFRDTAWTPDAIADALRALQITVPFEALLRALRVLQVTASGAVCFKHAGLQAFWIACHWRQVLVSAAPDERALLGGRLIVFADDHREREALLVEMLRREPATHARIARFTEACLRDPRLSLADGAPCVDPMQDMRCYLREAAIAIRCRVIDAPLTVDDGVIRSLAGVLWMQGESLRLWAPRLVARSAEWYWLVLSWRADLRGADLTGASLRGADLGGADLRGACLFGVDFCGADLSRAQLQGADLREVCFEEARLWGADLRGARLERAEMARADLRYALIDGRPEQADSDG